MKPGSPGKSDRLTGFATMLQAGCESTNGRRRRWPGCVVPALILIAVIGHLTAAQAQATPPPSHEDIQNSVGAVQTTVNGIDMKVDDVKSTLEQIPPAWSQILPAADRFKLVMGGAAVLDKETGLVWEQSPVTLIREWRDALIRCNNLAVGGRFGWRLPTLHELVSLVDPNNPDGNPDLPAGHPFSHVQSSLYWSATPLAGTVSTAWFVDFGFGGMRVFDKGYTLYVWCVRGGQGVDPQ